MTKTNTSLPPEATPAIPDRLYFRIGDVAELAGLKPYVLRFWESEFPMIAPQKSNTGHRVYRRADVETVLLIKHLLYTERYSIEGARKRIKELRKDGELKAFKAEKVVPAQSPAQLTDRKERLAQIRGLARELRGMSKAPIRELFEA